MPPRIAECRDPHRWQANLSHGGLLMFRLIAIGALLTALHVPAITRAAPAAALAEKDGPTFIVRVQSINQLLSHAEYLAGLAGKEETAKQVLAFIRPMIGEKGL